MGLHPKALAEGGSSAPLCVCDAQLCPGLLSVVLISTLVHICSHVAELFVLEGCRICSCGGC